MWHDKRLKLFAPPYKSFINIISYALGKTVAYVIYNRRAARSSIDQFASVESSHCLEKLPKALLRICVLVWNAGPVMKRHGSQKTKQMCTPMTYTCAAAVRAAVCDSVRGSMWLSGSARGRVR